jgi:pimeloyl-ACP methyl ester carboxylesterase
MERLIQNMMKQFNISEDTLKEKDEIPIQTGETLSWRYYCYAKENPIVKWNIPTSILCGSEDVLTNQEVFKNFSERFNCHLTVLEGGGHWFHTDKQLTFYNSWLDEHI